MKRKTVKRTKNEFIQYLPKPTPKSQKAKAKQFSLLSLFLIQEEWIKENEEDTYYLYDMEKDEYKNLYYILKDIHSDFGNPKRLNKNVRYINEIISLSQDHLISGKIKKEAYSSLYEDLQYRLNFDGIQITDEETIKREIQKGVPLDEIMIEYQN